MENKLSTSNSIPIFKILPYFSGFVVFLGVFRLMSFYNSFNIAIISYLEFSEIINSILDIIIFLVLFLIYGILQKFLSEGKAEVENKFLKLNSIYKVNKFSKRLIFYIKNAKVLWIVTVSMIIFTITLHFVHKSITLYTIFTLVAGILFTLIFIIVVNEVEYKHRELNSTDEARYFTMIAQYTIFLIFIIHGITLIDVREIKVNKTTFGYTIILDDNKEIISDSTFYYIGKTNNYVFMHDEVKNITEVYPLRRVQKLIIKGD